MAMLTVLTTALVVTTCLGRGGGVGACRSCRGHSRGLSGPELEPPIDAAPLGPARDDDGTLAGPDWPTTGPPPTSCTRAPSRGLQGAELEPKSLASRVMGSRICERRRVDDDEEPRISSISLLAICSRRLLLRRLFLPACFYFLSKGPRCIWRFALVFLPFSGYRVLPRDRLDIDAHGTKAVHPRHFVTSHARTIIVGRDIGLELALRSVKKEIFFFLFREILWDPDDIK